MELSCLHTHEKYHVMKRLPTAFTVDGNHSTITQGIPGLSMLHDEFSCGQHCWEAPYGLEIFCPQAYLEISLPSLELVQAGSSRQFSLFLSEVSQNFNCWQALLCSVRWHSTCKFWMALLHTKGMQRSHNLPPVLPYSIMPIGMPGGINFPTASQHVTWANVSHHPKGKKWREQVHLSIWWHLWLRIDLPDTH